MKIDLQAILAKRITKFPEDDGMTHEEIGQQQMMKLLIIKQIKKRLLVMDLI